MKEIPLTQGKVARVSDHRFDYLNQWKWQAHKGTHGCYATRKPTGARGPTILMHREIMQAPDGLEVDHWDGDGLNNVDEKLRVCTTSQNGANRKVNSNNTSGFKGVSASGNTYKNPYKAEIKVFGRKIYLGSFETAEDAAHAYDEAAKKFFGPFAKTNFK